ncbi:MAG: type III-B CRISPR module-associated protein Cmr5 [Thermodesulfobacteriota bacterium]
MSQAVTSTQQSLDQRRAKHAWEAVQNIVKDRDKAKKYGQQAKKLPMRIMASGLGQALVFLHAKKYAPELLRDLGDWVLHKKDGPDQGKPKDTGKEDAALIKAILKYDSPKLRMVTDEVLAYLQWLNRFAEAEGLTKED